VNNGGERKMEERGESKVSNIEYSNVKIAADQADLI
jgi:hypothetical protein